MLHFSSIHLLTVGYSVENLWMPPESTMVGLSLRHNVLARSFNPWQSWTSFDPQNNFRSQSQCKVRCLSPNLAEDAVIFPVRWTSPPPTKSVGNLPLDVLYCKPFIHFLSESTGDLQGLCSFGGLEQGEKSFLLLLVKPLRPCGPTRLCWVTGASKAWSQPNSQTAHSDQAGERAKQSKLKMK